jgi:hypothetical protein
MKKLINVLLAIMLFASIGQIQAKEVPISKYVSCSRPSLELTGKRAVAINAPVSQDVYVLHASRALRQSSGNTSATEITINGKTYANFEGNTLFNTSNAVFNDLPVDPGLC